MNDFYGAQLREAYALRDGVAAEGFEEGRRLERDHILATLRAFVSEDGLVCSNGDVIYYAEGDPQGVRRAIEIIEGEEQ